MANWFVGMPVGGAWLEPVLADAPSHVRRFLPEDVHLTVAFLGSVGPERAAVAWTLAEAYAGPPLSVTLGALAPMGPRRRPSALSLLLTEGAEAAIDLITVLRDPMLAAAAARPDLRPPKPHITVARPARAAMARQRSEAIAWARAKEPLGLRVVLDTLVLYTWSEDRTVRQFRSVATKKLGRRFDAQ